MLPLGEAGWRALGTSLYYFCNALWVYNYFKRKCENKKKMHCRWWLQPWNWKMLASWKKSYNKPREHIEKQRHYFASKGAYSQSYDFSSRHVWMWQLDRKESWGPKNWWFPIVALEKTLESPLDGKEIKSVQFSSVQFSSVAQSCPALCDPINCSMPGLPVHHHLPGFTQTHVCWIGDAIQPSHPLSSPSPPAPNPSQHKCLFQWVNFSHEVAKVLEFQLFVLPKNTQGWSPLEWTGWISLQTKGLTRVFSNTTVQKRQFFGTQLSSQSNSHIHTWPLEKP